MRGSFSGWLGQDRQRAASEGGHPHLTESPFPQQGWGPGAATDAGWCHWWAQEAELTKDLWRQLTVPVTVFDETEGYIWQVFRTSFIFALKKARAPDQNVGETNLFQRLELKTPPFLMTAPVEKPSLQWTYTWAHVGNMSGIQYSNSRQTLTFWAKCTNELCAINESKTFLGFQDNRLQVMCFQHLH